MAKPSKSDTAPASAPAVKTGDKPTQTTIDAATGAIVPSKLSQEQAEELEKCEAVIQKSWGTFLEVGRALATIRDKELYKGKCDTFDQYWRKELGVSRSYAYSLIESAEVNDQLSAIADIEAKPMNEAQLRELIPVPEAKRVDAWKSAVELAGDKPITAKIVRKAAVKFKPRKSGKKSRAAKKSAAGGIDLGPALKLLTNVEKLAEGNKDKAILKELSALRRLLEKFAQK